MFVERNHTSNTENTAGPSHTAWFKKWQAYPAIVAVVAMSWALSACGHAKAATKLPDTQVLVSLPGPTRCPSPE